MFPPRHPARITAIAATVLALATTAGCGGHTTTKSGTASGHRSPVASAPPPSAKPFHVTFDQAKAALPDHKALSAGYTDAPNTLVPYSSVGACSGGVVPLPDGWMPIDGSWQKSAGRAEQAVEVHIATNLNGATATAPTIIAHAVLGCPAAETKSGYKIVNSMATYSTDGWTGERGLSLAAGGGTTVDQWTYLIARGDVLVMVVGARSPGQDEATSSHRVADEYLGPVLASLDAAGQG